MPAVRSSSRPADAELARAPLTFPDLPRLELDQLLEQLVERAQEVMGTQGRLRALLRATQVIGGEVAVAAVLQRTVAAARELVGARYAAIVVIGPHGGPADFVHEDMDAETVARIGRPPQGTGLLGALIDDPQPLHLPVLAGDPRSTGPPAAHPPMVGGSLGVPIRVRGGVFGNLHLVESTRGGEFTPEDEELLVALAATAATAIDYAQMYESVRARGEWSAASAAVTRQLLAADGDARTDPLQLIVESSWDIADADLVVVLRPEERDGHVADLVIEVGGGPGGAELRGRRVPVAGSLPGRAYSTGEPARTGHAGEGSGLMAAELGPALAVPLIGSGRMHGVLTVARRAGRPGFSAADLAMASSFGTQAALAIDLAEARAVQELARTLADRERIAADLHDHVIQQLFATGLSLQTAAAITREDPMRIRLDVAINDLDGTIRQIRSTIFQLQVPPQTGDPGVRGRLLGVVAGVRPALGFEPGLQFSGLQEDTLPPAVVEDLLAVLREALTNVARHAGASTAEVDVTCTGGRLMLQVADDGRGLGPTERRSGLANMRRRAEAHSGSLEITSAEPTGTTLCWSVPIG